MITWKIVKLYDNFVYSLKADLQVNFIKGLSCIIIVILMVGTVFYIKEYHMNAILGESSYHNN